MARPISITNYGLTQDSSQKKWGSYSIYMSGTSNADSEYARTAFTTDLNLGSGDWTIEFWARPENTETFSNLTVLRAQNQDNRQWRVDFSIDALSMFHNNLSPNPEITKSFSGSINTWYHCAVVKYSGTIKCYVNGVGGTGVSSSIDYGAINNSWRISIGSWDIGEGTDDPLNSFDGWVDNIRISNTARYTADFTPPSAALTTDSNTLWLPNDENTGSFLADYTGAVTHNASANLTASFTQTARGINNIIINNIIADDTWDTIPGDVWTGFQKDNWIWIGLHLQSSFAAQAQGTLVIPSSADLASNFAVTANGGFLISGSSQQESSFALSAEGLRIVSGASNLDTSATLDAEALITLGGRSDLQSVFTVSSLGGIIQPVSASLALEATVSARGRNIYDVDIVLDNWMSLTAQPSLILGGRSALANDTELTADSQITRNGQADLFNNFNIFVSSDLFRPGQADLFVDTDLASSALITRGGRSDLSASFVLSGQAKVDYGSIALSMSTALTARAGVIFGARSNLVMNGFLLSVGIRAHGGNASLSMSTALTARAVMTFGARSNLEMTGFVLGAGESVPPVKGIANLNSTFALSGEGDYKMLESDFIYYLLPELRSLEVKNETRTFEVLIENRSFDVEGESRTQKVLPETRTLEVV